MTAPAPNACAWCGIGQREHMQRWHPRPGWHGWTAPGDQQRLQRMRDRRAGRRT